MSIDDTLLRTYRSDSGDLTVDARWVTWDLAVFEIRHGEVEGVVAVPRADLDSFVASLWDGRLDDELVAQVRSPRTQRRRLADGDDVTQVGVYGGVKDPSRLSPTERNVFTGRVGGSGGLRGRSAKRSSSSGGLVPVPKKSRTLVVAAVIAAVILVAGAAVAMTGGGDKQAVATKDTTTTLVPLVTTSTTEPIAENQRYQYEVTVTYSSLETGEFEERPPSPFNVGWNCGDFEIRGSAEVPTCYADPRSEWAYFAAGFDLPEPITEDFTFNRPLPTCVPGTEEPQPSGAIYNVKGYGTETMTGTIETGHQYTQCSLSATQGPDEAGYSSGFHLVGTFVAHRVDELGSGAGLTTTTTPTATAPTAPPNTGTTVVGPVIGVG